MELSEVFKLSEVFNLSTRQERIMLRTRASLRLLLTGALIFATFLTYQNDWVPFGAGIRNIQKIHQLRLIAKQEGMDGPTYNSTTSFMISLAPSMLFQPIHPQLNLTKPSLGKPNFMVRIPERSQESRQIMTVNTKQSECPGERNVVDYYNIFFEPFDTSIVSDSLLESAFRRAYNDNVDEEDCQTKVISVDRITAPVAAAFGGEAETTSIATERMQFLVTFSQFDDDSGLFPAPLVRASFVATLNEILILEGLPIFVLSVRSSADPGNTEPEPTVQSSFPTPEPIPSVTRRPTMEPSRAPVGPTPIPSAAPTKVDPADSLSPIFMKSVSEAPSLNRVLTEAPQSNSRFTLKPTVTSTDSPSLTSTQIASTSLNSGKINFPSSLLPTRRPTRSPTTAPTPRTTSKQPARDQLTSSPTKGPLPVPFPTARPTDSPATKMTVWGRQPSESPSNGPWESPSPTVRVLTEAPQSKAESTSKPTVTPSRPSLRPTRSPTPRPNISLVDTPTSGSTEPFSTTSGSLPIESPRVTPTASPSVVPSESPDFILQEPELKSVQMVLTGVSLLSSRSQRVWTEATAIAIEEEVTSFLKTKLESANAQVTLISQNPRRRNLQDAPLTNQSTTVISSNLTITFDVKISIRTILVEDHNIRRYVGAALDTAAEKRRLMNQLQSSGETAFQNLTSIQLILPPPLSENALQSGSNDSQSISTGTAIGITVIAIAAIGFCGAGVLWIRRSQAFHQTSDSGQPTKSLREFDGDGVLVNVVERPDGGDVSTLGDPIGQGTPAPQVDSSVAEETASLPYDFKVASHRLPSLGESASYSFSDTSSRVVDLQTDNDTLDEQYFNENRIEVEAPAGMLGLVLETDSEGVAAVYNMKQSSPLVDRIKIGDKLVSVDGIDVTAKPIKSVMEVIASKQQNKVRGLVFCRPPRASMVHDDSGEVDA